ncbi:cytochrome C oxidase subunit II [Fischerella thermalis CCMEE 5273]|uniref:Cytochrome c oxidase subunit 2 n=1 Tax=Fischerella thermalis JSC-11 TaxID=741277 RepID=G6FPR9_9CYAN|nr:cytochrome c oxidase, subunit II [Fischerella thermalis JSC-11]PLZ06659.1 cytochrome C oxidase subunit II [Fischerella thermalis WC119]PLZ07562.1 cytochrome C oxidase subunit II [Fischerella thermalis WC114]PLZ16554.1 cytochrome C oxidase subunit II [Fischerella thermalis WC341]PLZ18643.1 cytochrome C oxidase subunit II [Fischerella thermalis WC1110]PLZ21081.1 cytochrome C oxidase subunit II [Fischerella thermalis WC157]PLZ25764.1 cytochrome C oxidase subunit II [Fischerella thermalis WC55
MVSSSVQVVKSLTLLTVKIPSSIWTLLIGIVLTLVSLWYGQNHGLLPTQASDEAVLVDGLFNAMMTVSTGIFLIVEGVLIYSAFKYRRRAGDDADGQPVHGNVPLEILWTAIPAIIVIGISVYSFDVYNEMGGFDPHAIHDAPRTPQAMKMPGAAIAATLTDTPPSDQPNLNQQKSDEAMQDPATAAVRNADQIPQKQDAPGVGSVAPTIGASRENQGTPPELVINVTGLQYAFIFTYPDTGITSGELHVPIGREVKLNMSANDVIHAFWVPEFRLKQDVIPGRQTEVRFTPKTEGTYAVVCAELCGPYHGAMRTQVVVEKPEAFEKWVQEQQVASAETLNQAVAVNPAELSPAQYLAPYTQEMGIQPEMLHQLHK